jgi:hypothetical protein
MTSYRVAMLWMAAVFVLAGIAPMAANELTDSDREYLRTITPSQSPGSLCDMTPAEARCMPELINRPGDENERRREVFSLCWMDRFEPS